MKNWKKFGAVFMALTVLVGTMIGTEVPVMGAEQESQTVHDRIKVACVGDSITYGHGSTDPAVDSYPAHLQGLMGIQYEVVNFGVSGRVMNDGKGWTSYVSTNEYTNSKAYQPDIVIIMLGTNDSKDDNWEGEQRYEDSARALIRSYQELESAPTIYMATSPRVADDEQMKELNEPWGNFIWNSRIKGEIVPLQKKIAEEMGCKLIDINAKTEALEDLNDYLSWDFIHPHDQGYELLAQWMYEGLDVCKDVGLLPIADTNSQTWENERYNNYGGQSFIQVQRDARAEGLGEMVNPDWDYDSKLGFLKYELPNSAEEIESARLSLSYLGQKAGEAQTDSIRVALANPDWQEGTGREEGTVEEGTLTGMNLPELYYDAENLEETSVVSEEFALGEGGKVIEIDVTKLVQKFREDYPDEPYISFVFNETVAGNRLHFGTREAGGGYGARLHVNFKGETELQDSALRLAIGMAEKLADEQEKYVVYTEKTWEAVQTALDHAKALLNNSEATQEEADNAFLNLMTAVNLLESNVQNAGLGTAIEGVKAILADASALADYTPESVEAVRSALAEAEAVYADTEAAQTAINQAATNLMTAVNNLLVTETDNRLDILIQKAEELLQKEDQYTNDSVQALKDALEAAKEVAAKKDATEQEINDAYNALAEAMASLVRVANKAELENALNKANEILTNAGKYTDSSLECLQEAKDAAQGVYDNDNATQEEIEEALKALINEILEVRLLGDVNLDEAVDSADAQALLRYNAELEELSEEQLDAADVNRDDAADSSDAGRILQYAAEMIEEF